LVEETDLTYEGIETFNCADSIFHAFHKEETDLTYEGIETPPSKDYTFQEGLEEETDLTYEGIETEGRLYQLIKLVLAKKPT